MSKQMIDTFFPGAIEYLNRTDWGRQLYVWLLPQEVATRCPEPSVSLWDGSDEIRSPFLLVACYVGMAIGFIGAFQLPKTSLWCVSLFFFGVMNVAAVRLHCLWPSPVASYPEEYPFLWWLDIYATGVSATALLAASFEGRTRLAFWIFTAIQAVGIAVSVLWYGSFEACYIEIETAIQPFLPFKWMIPIPKTSLIESWYLVPPALAGVPVLMQMIQSRASFNLVVLYLLGAVFALSGFVLDPTLCDFSTKFINTYDFLYLTTFVFWGCNLSFFSIVCWRMSSKCKVD